MQPQRASRGSALFRQGGVKLAAIHPVVDAVDVVRRNAEMDCLLASLLTDHYAGAYPQMKKTQSAPDNAGAHGLFDPHRTGTRQFEHHRTMQHLAQRHGQRRVMAILMYMPDIESTAVA